jgi:hypothetical protein
MAKPGKAEQSAARSERLSAALRENLKRRKEQARERKLARNRPGFSETPAPDARFEAQNPDFRRNRDDE